MQCALALFPQTEWDSDLAVRFLPLVLRLFLPYYLHFLFFLLAPRPMDSMYPTLCTTLSLCHFSYCPTQGQHNMVYELLLESQDQPLSLTLKVILGKLTTFSQPALSSLKGKHWTVNFCRSNPAIKNYFCSPLLPPHFPWAIVSNSQMNFSKHQEFTS